MSKNNVQVVMISGIKIEDLQRHINEFLDGAEILREELIDIKMCMVEHMATAMIVYESGEKK